jgi:hypothetical protein
MNKLKEIGNKYYQECEVVMLDSNNKSYFGFLTKKGKEVFNDLRYFNMEMPQILDSVNQHLYFLSNEEIKGGDCYFDLYENKILQCLSHMVYINTMMRKVIATTDTSLGLPQPSKEFIQAYIKAYNEGKPITNVLVEYEGYECKNGHHMAYQTTCVYPHCDEYNYPVLKTNSSNEITIKKVKDSWTREEIIIDIEEAMIQGLDLGQYRDKWIEENL